MKKLSKIFMLVVAALCCAVIAGCDKGSSDTIEIEYWHANGAALTTVLEEIKADFEAKYEGKYTIKLTSYGDYDTLRDTITSAIAAGMAPTAAQTYPDHVSLYLEGAALQSLDKYINDPEHGISAEEQAQFVEGFWHEGVIYDTAGTRYAMPFNKSTELMYYNKTLFDKYGWAVPTTWDEVIAVAKEWMKTSEYAAAVAANPGKVYPLGYDSEPNMFITLTQQWGAKYTGFDASGKGQFNAFGAVAEDAAKSKEAMNWYLEQFNAGYMATSTAFGTNYCSDAFKAGQCIMTIGSSAGASYNDLKDSGQETAVSFVPQKDKENGQVIQQGTNISLFKCKDKDEELGGWLWLKHMVSYESALKWALETAYFPTRKDVMASAEYQNHVTGKIVADDGSVIEGKQTLAAKAKQAGILQSAWFYTNIAFPGSSKARDNAETVVQQILYGSVSVDKAYADAYNSILND